MSRLPIATAAAGPIDTQLCSNGMMSSSVTALITTCASTERPEIGVALPPMRNQSFAPRPAARQSSTAIGSHRTPTADGVRMAQQLFDHDRAVAGNPATGIVPAVGKDHRLAACFSRDGEHVLASRAQAPRNGRIQ